MCKFCVFVGMLALLTLALPGYSQETGQTGTVEQKAPAKLPAARPKLPNVIIFESSVGNVHFPHKVHQKKGCKKCHHQIHANHSNLENIADETLNAKVVVHKSCWNCHLSGTGPEASERCSFCHVKE